MFKKLLGSKASKIIDNGLYADHPVFAMGLGICSALAISNKVENALAMGLGVMFVMVATAIFVSALRKLIPARARIISYMIIISSFVIIVDRVLKAYFPEISESVGPYVGLIITNCIIMGRAEAFYIQNNLYHSLLDAVSNGLAYTYTLILIAVVREVLAFGTLLGFSVLPETSTKWVVMSMAPGAFFLLGIGIWISKTLTDPAPEPEEG